MPSESMEFNDLIHMWLYSALRLFQRINSNLDCWTSLQLFEVLNLGAQKYLYSSCNPRMLLDWSSRDSKRRRPLCGGHTSHRQWNHSQPEHLEEYVREEQRVGNVKWRIGSLWAIRIRNCRVQRFHHVASVGVNTLQVADTGLKTSRLV